MRSLTEAYMSLYENTTKTIFLVKDKDLIYTELACNSLQNISTVVEHYVKEKILADKITAMKLHGKHSISVEFDMYGDGSEVETVDLLIVEVPLV